MISVHARGCTEGGVWLPTARLDSPLALGRGIGFSKMDGKLPIAIAGGVKERSRARATHTYATTNQGERDYFWERPVGLRVQLWGDHL